MFEGVTNWVEDKASNLLRTGIQAGGTLAGNAVGGVGSLVEGAGRSAGQSKPQIARPPSPQVYWIMADFWRSSCVWRHWRRWKSDQRVWRRN